MGANQSRDGRNLSDEQAASKVCYYDLLDVAQNASEEEIKKAYRRKALDLHPDRNLGNVETATKQFADVQAAYEILSDPQERAWYDSHRDIILDGRGDSDNHYESSVRVTTANDVLLFIRRFNGQVEFSDSPNGFYGGLQDFFGRLAQEEEIICQSEDLHYASYPSFGTSNDPYIDEIRVFYSRWANFATNKSFAWKDVYRLSDAPDRRIRRIMEKENKRLRDDAIREFNDAVRSLVAFARKRDPRIPTMKDSEIDRQKILREASLSQALKSKLANQTNVRPMDELPEWMRTTQPAEDEFSEEEIATPRQTIECVVCRKTFKSEKQYEAHEKSKKHLKAVHQIKRDMYRDSTLLDLQETQNMFGASPSVEQSDLDDTPEVDPQSTSSSPDDKLSVSREVPSQGSDSVSSSSASIQTDALADQLEQLDTYGNAREVPPSEGDTLSQTKLREEKRSKLTNPDVGHSQTLHADKEKADIDKVEPKMGMAKAKRAKKAAKKSNLTMADNPDHQCLTCHGKFSSKTKLFAHIEKLDHAQALGQGSRAKSKGMS